MRIGSVGSSKLAEVCIAHYKWGEYRNIRSNEYENGVNLNKPEPLLIGKQQSNTLIFSECAN